MIELTYRCHLLGSLGSKKGLFRKYYGKWTCPLCFALNTPIVKRKCKFATTPQLRASQIRERVWSPQVANSQHSIPFHLYKAIMVRSTWKSTNTPTVPQLGLEKRLKSTILAVVLHLFVLNYDYDNHYSSHIFTASTHAFLLMRMNQDSHNYAHMLYPQSSLSQIRKAIM